MSKCHIECIFKESCNSRTWHTKSTKRTKFTLGCLAKLALCLKVRFPCLKKIISEVGGWDRTGLWRKRGGGWAGLCAFLHVEKREKNHFQENMKKTEKATHSHIINANTRTRDSGIEHSCGSNLSIFPPIEPFYSQIPGEVCIRRYVFLRFKLSEIKKLI